MTTAFINNPAYYVFEGNTFHVSRIFKWYSRDFGKDLPDYFLQYAKADLKKRLEQAGEGLRIKYLGYDWSLNGS